jgi:hypothetical protein
VPPGCSIADEVMNDTAPGATQFVTLLGGGAAWPLAARGQQSREFQDRRTVSIRRCPPPARLEAECRDRASLCRGCSNFRIRC